MVTALLSIALTGGATPATAADELYAVQGNDSFVIGTQMASRTVFNGSEQLQIAKTPTNTRYAVEARYTRSNEAGSTESQAHFVQELAPGGSFTDRENDDPDSLTILNQPFAVQLDSTTLSQLSRLTGSLPFDASSPIGGGTLRGSLRRGDNGVVDGVPAIGVRFEATGEMRGSLPEHPEIAILGSVQMNGTAYYSARSALLVALVARLTITGTLRDQKDATPVRIVYERTLRADDSLPGWAEAKR